MARRRRKKNVIKRKREPKKKTVRVQETPPDKIKRAPRSLSKKLLTAIVVILLVSLSVYAAFTVINNQKEDWTVMVYMAGDNSLSNMVDENLQAMMESGSNDIVDIVALTDKSGSSDARLVHVKKDNLKELKLGEVKVSGLNEVDTGDPETLSEFGKYVMKIFPSEHYFLIIWGHGQGWKGVASDKGGSILSMGEMRTALEELVDANHRKLDIIGFDACAMATSEGFYEISEYADILISSQKKEPDAGWPYKEIFKKIRTGEMNTGEEISTLVVNEYVNAYSKEKLPSQGFTVGLTAIKTSKNNDFYVAFQRFSNLLSSVPDSDIQKVGELRDGLETYEDPNNIDLKDLLKGLAPIFQNNIQLTMEISSLSKALKDVVLIEKHWNNPQSDIKIESGGGLCLYFPKTIVDQAYQDTTVARISMWDEFLNRV